MRCLCIGICQTEAVTTILKTIPAFTDIYTEILCYLVFTISADEMKNILTNILPTCDLIISQPVSDNYQGSDLFSTTVLRNKIKPGAKHIILPNCYFTGYDPLAFQITDEKGNYIHHNGISYFPSICFESLLKCDISQACIDWCNPDMYSITNLEKNYQATISELKNREEKIFNNTYGVDITISDYIEKNYIHMHLFHTYNHPTNLLLFELTHRILNILNIITDIDESKITRELLGDITIPPCPSLYYTLGMTFPYPLFNIFGNKYTTIQAMEKLSTALKQSDPKLHDGWLACIKWKRQILDGM